VLANFVRLFWMRHSISTNGIRCHSDSPKVARYNSSYVMARHDSRISLRTANRPHHLGQHHHGLGDGLNASHLEPLERLYGLVGANMPPAPLPAELPPSKPLRISSREIGFSTVMFPWTSRWHEQMRRWPRCTAAAAPGLENASRQRSSARVHSAPPPQVFVGTGDENRSCHLG